MRPALATVNGRVFMACKGSDGDASVYISEFNGTDAWAPFARVNAVGGTSDAPAMVGVGERLFMFWACVGTIGTSRACARGELEDGELRSPNPIPGSSGLAS